MQTTPIERDLPRVTLSADGYLFLTGGSNNTANLYDPAYFASHLPTQRWEQTLAGRNQFFSTHKTAWRMLLSPEKLSVYGHDIIRSIIGEHYRTPGCSFIARYGGENLIYPRELLIAQSRHYAIYPKTDSHWQSIGAFITFQAIMSDLNFEIDPALYTSLENVTLNYRGDLWSSAFPLVGRDAFLRKVTPPGIRMVYRNPILGLKRKLHLDNEGGLHVGSHAIFYHSKAPRKESVILFGSSFSECRLECSLLTTIVCSYFEEVHFIWSANLDFDYIQRQRPNVVIVETPERFLTACPSDDLRIEKFGVALTERWLERMANSPPN